MEGGTRPTLAGAQAPTRGKIPLVSALQLIELPECTVAPASIAETKDSIRLPEPGILML